MRNRWIAAFTIGLLSLSTQAQELKPIKGKSPKVKTVKLDNGDPDYFPHLQNLKSLPSPAGNYQKKKALVNQRKQSQATQGQSGQLSMKKAGPAPVLITEFQGNNTGGTPNDNDMCIGNNGQIVSVLNSNIRILDTSGKMLLSRSLEFFANSVGSLDRAYDPRAIYDPIHDRFIVMFLNEVDEFNNPVICFSETNDATGNWNCYLLPGDPLQDSSWSDYPIISITEDDVFITLNLLDWGKGWQDGFRQSIIWQIDLESGYDGDSLDHNFWSGIEFDGKPTWSICPAQGGVAPLQHVQYLLSVRPGDVQNDSVFLHTINGAVYQGDARLKTELFIANNSYGLPPSAAQNGDDDLQTNDARVLTAMAQNGLVHFSGNSYAFGKDKAGLYYGVLDPHGPKTANLMIYADDTYEFGYPDMAYAGTGASNDHSVIMTFSHSNGSIFPGTAVAYLDYSGDFSPITIVKDGLRAVDVIADTNSDERWGDYTGIQRRYNRKQSYWLAGSYGDRVYRTTIAEVSNQNPQLGLEKTSTNQTSLYPNPTQDKFNYRFEIEKSQYISFTLYDLQGKMIQTLLRTKAKGGLNRFSFVTNDLPTGTYILKVEGETIQESERFVVQR